MIIIDSSIVIANTLPDESNHYADQVLLMLAEDKLQAIVPAVFYLECTNVLLMAERSKRINRSQRIEYLDMIAQLPVDVDHIAANAESINTISSIAEEYNLTSYDAAYLELAKRKNNPLATLDKKLQQAAEQLRLSFNTKLM
jgi:predicted nucleic acid-binding protein